MQEELIYVFPCIFKEHLSENNHIGLSQLVYTYLSKILSESDEVNSMKILIKILPELLILS